MRLRTTKVKLSWQCTTTIIDIWWLISLLSSKAAANETVVNANIATVAMALI